MRNLILSTLSTLALLIYPLSLSAQNGKFENITLNVRVELQFQALTPDFNGDGVVNFADFLAFVGQFGTRQGDGRYDAKYDLDSDGAIGFGDFLIFSSFGKEVSTPNGGSGDDGSIVSIPDANLRAVIADSLGKASGAPITQAEMANLTVLKASNKKISDLTGLEFATNLKWVWFSDNQISDVSPLSNLTRLEHLNLSTNLISDISTLSNLTDLKWLKLFKNQISDVAPLSELTNLEYLNLYNNLISDISTLSGLINLTNLYLSRNNISDLSPLVANIGLGNGDEIDVRNNPLSATSLNTHIPALQGRGVEVRFGASKSGVEERKRGMVREE